MDFPLGLKNGEDVRDAGSRILVGAHGTRFLALSCFSGLLLTVARLKVNLKSTKVLVDSVEFPRETSEFTRVEFIRAL